MMIGDDSYRCPSDLVLTPIRLRRTLVVGQCLMAAWPEIIQASSHSCPCDFVLFNNAQQLPESPPQPASEYDFQLIHIPLRSVVPEWAYFRLCYDDAAAYQQLFAESRDRLSRFLESAMRWNVEHGLQSFVFNFLVPQQNPMGRLMPRYDLRNFVYFVEKLNEALAEEIAAYKNAHLFDFDQIVSTFGRRYFQDDVLWQVSHNSALTDADFELDKDRLEPAGRAREYYPVKTQEYLQYAWNELIALYRTISGTDTVKLVVLDLDDTLWRGIAAEEKERPPGVKEGWPLGLIETLGYLKRRGTLLAIMSKNEESNVERVWHSRVGNHLLALDDFAVRKINWRPKAQNFEDILQATNLLPRSVVYIDDNPVERESIRKSFPGVRVIGPTPLLWRRILLWSAETQVPRVTAESGNRTQMVQAQIQRESQRSRLSREDFLQSLELRMEIAELGGVGDEKFGRALELLNKTNQYNTTGKRWSESECVAAFEKGTRFFTFSAADKFTDYGTIGVAILDASCIAQFVMSCRVVGLEIERAALAHLVREAGDGQPVRAILHKTELNALAQHLYPENGFVEDGGEWIREPAEFRVPAHIELEIRTPASIGLRDTG